MGDGVDPVTGQGLSSMSHAHSGGGISTRTEMNELLEMCLSNVLRWLEASRLEANESARSEKSGMRAAEHLQRAGRAVSLARDLRKLIEESNPPPCPSCGEQKGAGAALEGLLTKSKAMLADFNRGALLAEFDWLGFARAIDTAVLGE